VKRESCGGYGGFGWAGFFFKRSRKVRSQERALAVRKAEGKRRSVLHQCSESDGKHSFSSKGDIGIVPLGKSRGWVDG
jgi:hypothetical protein